MIVDIHNHILPGFDDGAVDLEETMRMSWQAVENGITHIVASPHHRNGKYACNPDEIELSVFKINMLLRCWNIPVEILPGMEVHLYGSLADDLDCTDEGIVTLGNSNKYVLVELPYTHIPHSTGDIFYQMQLKGYIPVIAHPERNHEIKKHPNLLVDFIQKGALAQITAGSVTGKFGKETQKLSVKFMEHNLVHVIASDAHNSSDRSFQLKNAYHFIERQFSSVYKDILMENAIHIVTGKEFISPFPVKFERKKNYFTSGWWQKILGACKRKRF